jgi:hypothetical protein
MFRIWELESELLGMLEGAVIRYSYIFFQENKQKIAIFAFLGLGGFI